MFHFPIYFLLTDFKSYTRGHDKKKALTPPCHTKLRGFHDNADLDSGVSMTPRSFLHKRKYFEKYFSLYLESGKTWGSKIL